MTATTSNEVSLSKPKEIWNTMPGWGIVTNLIPPELIAARRLRVLRRLTLVALAGLLVLCIGVYAVAKLNNASASSALNDEQSTTTSLTQSESRFSDVTQIQASVDGTNARLAQLLAADIDLQPLLLQLRHALPASLDIKNISLSTTSATGNGAGFNGLDTSGHKVVGTVTIVGDASTFQGISDYVDALSKIDGVVNVVPTSAQGTKLAIDYNITLNLTDKLYSHRFDVTPKAGN
ncbi:MAG TPA: hypothetical protein VHO01_00265 [Jatrophihabitans sp.]|nr:hypothetical protein [Jatrophihabitans sp.]